VILGVHNSIIITAGHASVLGMHIGTTVLARQLWHSCDMPGFVSIAADALGLGAHVCLHQTCSFVKQTQQTPQYPQVLCRTLLPCV
jgi:hypothetical protein